MLKNVKYSVLLIFAIGSIYFLYIYITNDDVDNILVYTPENPETDDSEAIESTSVERFDETLFVGDLNQLKGEAIPAPSKIALAFQNEMPIIEALSALSKENVWNQDTMVGNIFLWNDLCEDFDIVDADSRVGQQGMRAEILKEVSVFCSGYNLENVPEFQSIDQGADFLSEEHSKSWQELMRSPEDFGKETALRNAISELDFALRNYDEFKAMEITWFLSSSDLIDPPLGNQVSDSDMLYNGLVMSAVSMALFCNQLGGCYETHPLTLRVCMILPGRYCFQPNNFYHAVEQTHTGMELIAFRSMLSQINSLLFAFRRGDF